MSQAEAVQETKELCAGGLVWGVLCVERGKTPGRAHLKHIRRLQVDAVNLGLKAHGGIILAEPFLVLQAVQVLQTP